MEHPKSKSTKSQGIQVDGGLCTSCRPRVNVVWEFRCTILLDHPEQLVNVSSGRVERDFAVHTFPVAGIEWAGLHAVLSHAHQGGNSIDMFWLEYPLEIPLEFCLDIPYTTG